MSVLFSAGVKVWLRSADTPTLEAVEIMRRHNCGCLPVVKDGRLVGIVTAYDFLAVSARLFEEQLTDPKKP